jgi:hypothetical protein
MSELWEVIELCLNKAQEVLDGLPPASEEELQAPSPAAERLRWIERQIGVLLGKLAALQADIASGLSLAEMGFAEPQELHELLSDIAAQVEVLKAIGLSVAKGLNR